MKVRYGIIRKCSLAVSNQQWRLYILRIVCSISCMVFGMWYIPGGGAYVWGLVSWGFPVGTLAGPLIEIGPRMK